MHRLFAIAVLGAIAVLPTGLEAQYRWTFANQMGGGARFSAPMGNRMMGGPGFRSFPAGRGFGFRRFGDRDFDDRRFGGFGGVGFGHNPRFRVFSGGCFGCRARFARRSFYSPYYPYAYYPYAYPPYYSPYDYVDYAPRSYASNPTVMVQAPPAPERSYESEPLVQEVRGLREEVRQLREEQNSRQQPRQTGPQPSASAEEPARTTVLVFRDGHRSEVQNYAVTGKTLWVFNERRANKVLLSDLDIPATRSANSERGVEFSLPQ